MPAFTSEGIIVKRSNFGEADRLLTVITPFKGKITVLARGVRKITSRRGGNVELLNKVKLHLFKGQGMTVLNEAESLATFPKIKSDLILSSYGSYIAEISEKLLAENEPNPKAYQLLSAILALLENNPRQIFIRAYEVKLLTVLGFWSLGQVEVRGEVKNILSKLEHSDWQEIDQIAITQAQALELERILRYYIEKVLESTVKSVRIIQKLKEKNE